jgi:hypothetical protein
VDVWEGVVSQRVVDAVLDDIGRKDYGHYPVTFARKRACLPNNREKAIAEIDRSRGPKIATLDWLPSR